MIRSFSFAPVFSMLMASWALLLLSACSGDAPVDLRSDMLLEEGIKDGYREQALQLLKNGDNTAGLTYWSQIEEYDLVLEDVWADKSKIRDQKPWPDDCGEIRFHFVPGISQGIATFQQGSRMGEKWQYAGGETVRYVLGKEPDQSFNRDIQYWITRVQFFQEFSTRISDAEILSFAGEGSMNDQFYYQVFATWGSPEPSSQYDQYLVWIDPEDFTIRRIDFTSRDVGDDFSASMILDDFRKVGPMTLPFLLSVRPDAMSRDYIHEYRIKTITLGLPPRQ